MGKVTKAGEMMLLALLAALSPACKRTETPPRATSAAREAAEEHEEERKVAERARGPERGSLEKRGEEEKEEGDSEEARETAEELRLRERAVKQMQEYRARNCTEAIAKVRDLLASKKDRWLERDERGQIPADLLQTLTQAELWAAEGESLCKGDPARSHLDDLRTLMVAIWKYPRSVPRQALEERLRVLG